MTRIINSLAEIGAEYDVLFCDLWGCVHNGQAAYPAAIAALRDYRAAGGKVVLVTNAPRPRASVQAQMERLGVPADAWDDIVTSGDAAQDALFAGQVGSRVWHLGPDKDTSFFEGDPRAAGIRRMPLEDAEGIVATGLFNEFTETPENYRAVLTEAAARGLPMLCANPDIVVDYGNRRMYCAGALAQLYETLGGRTLYFGKPHAPIYDLARRRLGVAGARELAVGDGIITDIEGARRQGIDALFVTGGLAADQLGPDVEHPDPALLAAYLDGQGGPAPRLAIGRLR